MSLLLRSFGAALADVLRPRMLANMVWPLLVLGLAVGVPAVLFWDQASGGLLRWLSGLALVEAVQARWLAWQGGGGGQGLPLLEWLATLGGVLVSLMLAALLFMVALLCAVVLASAVLAPLVARDVARRCHPRLAQRGEATFRQSLMWSLGALARALLLLLLSLPLWWVPVLHLLVPPLVWGWLNARVMGFDVLSEWATRAELLALLRSERRSLFVMGVATSLLGAAPALVWISGLWFAALFVVLMPLAALIYMAVLVFTALWFSHYTLAVLARMRESVDGSMDDLLLIEKHVQPDTAN